MKHNKHLKNELSRVVIHKKFLVLLVLIGGVVGQSFAQYELKKYSINNGGSMMRGGSYEMISSIGQVDTGVKQTGEVFSLTSGFLQQNNDLIFKNGVE